MAIKGCEVSDPSPPPWHTDYTFSRRIVKDEYLPLFHRELESVD